jgi:hypothetical protein
MKSIAVLCIVMMVWGVVRAHEGIHDQYDRGVMEGDTYICADPVNCCIMAIRCLRMMMFAADDPLPADADTYHETYMGKVVYKYLDTENDYGQVFASDSNVYDCPFPRCSRGFQPGPRESHLLDTDSDINSVGGADQQVIKGRGCFRWSPFTTGPDYHPQFHSLSECLAVNDGVADEYNYAAQDRGYDQPYDIVHNTPPRAQHMMRHCTWPFLETHRKCISAWVDSQFLSKVGWNADNAHGEYLWDDVNSDALPKG